MDLKYNAIIICNEGLHILMYYMSTNYWFIINAL